MTREHAGQAISWKVVDGVLELSLHRPPANELGTLWLDEMERFVPALERMGPEVRVLLVHSEIPAGFCAGADLRELYERSSSLSAAESTAGVRDFLERIHAVLTALDAWPGTTIGAVHGVVFGGGLELALALDVLIADKMARFCMPELRLGLIPGFGGIPRLRRDVGNAAIRDLLFTGRSVNASRAHALGLVSQLCAEGQALRVARATAQQMVKFDPETVAAAKRFTKPIPREELAEEIEVFCRLFARPAVQEALKRFVESRDVQPYLP
jgi:enoyl-CoA hydratase/carnithine racemase